MVVTGWIVVERFARRRELRGDLRSAVTSLSNAVDEIRAAAVTVYCLAGNDPQTLSLAATIRLKISALSEQLSILKEAGLDIDTDELLKRFRQSVTGGDFESQARQPLQADSPAFAKVSGDAQALAREVQTAMLKKLLNVRRPGQRYRRTLRQGTPSASPTTRLNPQ